MKRRHLTGLAGSILLLAGNVPAHSEGLIGCEHHVRYGAPSQEPTLLCRLGYALSHDANHKVADWVAYQLIEDTLCAGTGPRSPSSCASTRSG